MADIALQEARREYISNPDIDHAIQLVTEIIRSDPTILSNGCIEALEANRRNITIDNRVIYLAGYWSGGRVPIKDYATDLYKLRVFRQWPNTQYLYPGLQPIVCAESISETEIDLYIPSKEAVELMSEEYRIGIKTITQAVREIQREYQAMMNVEPIVPGWQNLIAETISDIRRELHSIPDIEPTIVNTKIVSLEEMRVVCSDRPEYRLCALLEYWIETQSPLAANLAAEAYLATTSPQIVYPIRISHVSGVKQYIDIGPMVFLYITFQNQDLYAAAIVKATGQCFYMDRTHRGKRLASQFINDFLADYGYRRGSRGLKDWGCNEVPMELLSALMT